MALEVEGDEELEGLGEYRCYLRNSDGISCGDPFAFGSMEALLLRAGRARNILSETSLLTITNQCLRRLQVLSARENARRHAMRSHVRNRCAIGRSSYTAAEVVQPFSLDCPVYSYVAQDL
eukprot:5815712-Pyramimonas_sp.AAC.1